MVMISVVMAVLNRKDLVGQAISSVINQSYGDWELIIVDGGSTDGTLDIIKRYAALDDRISLYVEEKLGQYAALNYGMRKARGDVIGILHSDDMYPPEALKYVAEVFSKDSKLDVLCPRVLLIVDHGGRIETEGVYQTNLRFENLVLGKPFEPARFYRKRLFESVGPIDESYSYAGHREWWIRVSLRPDIKWTSIPQICYIYRRHAQSATANFNKYTHLLYFPEHYRMFKKLLDSGLLNDEQKKIVKQRWLNDSISGFLLSLHRGKFGDTLFYFVKGTEINHSYLLQLVRKKIKDWLR